METTALSLLRADRPRITLYVVESSTTMKITIRVMDRGLLGKGDMEDGCPEKGNGVPRKPSEGIAHRRRSIVVNQSF
ncbi:hypothetical protein BHM03_00047337 [Ensete ventricosum]|nr:hypothetical protein BHM03_00047337 [Ensete ventricosum]